MKCKCGILATKGVVPSELGYGWYCGMSTGEYWEGRTCDWEWFEGREDLRLRLGRTSEPWKSRETRELKEEIRERYHVPLPEDDVYSQVLDDYCRDTGKSRLGSCTEDVIMYWRQNRSKYPPPLTKAQKDEKRRMRTEQRELERERARERSRERARNWKPDLNAKYAKGSIEEYYQQEARKKLRIQMESAEEAQLEAMRALVGELPVGMEELMHQEDEK